MFKKFLRSNFLKSRTIQASLIGVFGGILIALITLLINQHFENKKNNFYKANRQQNDKPNILENISDTIMINKVDTHSIASTPQTSINEKRDPEISKLSIKDRICMAQSYTENSQFNEAIKIYEDIRKNESEYLSNMSAKILNKIIQYVEEDRDIELASIEYKNYFLNHYKCN